MLQRVLYLFIGLVVVLALASATFLLIFDASLPFLQPLEHAPVSAAPLLLIGLASLCFQLMIRPKLLDLLKAFIVSAAFILWGIYQLLPPGRFATTLGDVVIVLFVIDLGWMMVGRLKHRGWPRRTLHKEAISPSERVLNHDPMDLLS